MATFEQNIVTLWEQFEESVEPESLKPEEWDVHWEADMDARYELMLELYDAKPQLFSHPPRPPRKRPS